MSTTSARTAPKGRPTPRRREAVTAAPPRWRWWLEWLAVAVLVAGLAVALFTVVGTDGGGGGGHVPVVDHGG